MPSVEERIARIEALMEAEESTRRELRLEITNRLDRLEGKIEELRLALGSHPTSGRLNGNAKTAGGAAVGVAVSSAVMAIGKALGWW